MKKFKKKIKQLDDSTSNQAQYNSIISDLFPNMNLDEEYREKEKNEENKEEKQNDQNDHKKKDKEDKEQDQQKMSIDAGVPDLENEARVR